MLTHDVVQEVDGIDALSGPCGLSVEERIQMVEVNLASPPQMDRMLVASLAWLGGLSLFIVKVDRDSCLITIETSTGPKLSVMKQQ
jgi:hypothetical protein